jgi:Tfp pilus assembly protein PilF
VALAEAISLHAATTWVLESRQWDFVASSYPALELVHRLRTDLFPTPGQGQADGLRLYEGIVAGIHRLQDQMLGRLLQLCGPDTTVILVSGYGNPSGDLGLDGDGLPMVQPIHSLKRSPGFVCLCGPSLPEDELIHGVHALDIAPTILSLLGVPLPSELEGKPIAAILCVPINPSSRQETVAGPGDARVPPVDSEPEIEVALARLAAMGYTDSPPEHERRMLEANRAERTYSLALIHRERGGLEQASALIEGLVAAEPSDPVLVLILAECWLDLGRREACRQLLRESLSRQAAARWEKILRVYLGLVEGRLDEARTGLESLDATLCGWKPHFFNRLGLAYLQEYRLDDAECAFRGALGEAEGFVGAHVGLAKLELHRGHCERAVDSALEALGHDFALPDAHLVLGMAYMRLGRSEQAHQALKLCVTHDPSRYEAHRLLAVLEERMNGNRAAAAYHQAHAAVLLKQGARS